MINEIRFSKGVSVAKMSGLVAFLLRFRNTTTCKKRKIKPTRRMRRRNESTAIRRHSKTTVDLRRNSDRTSIQQMDHDPTTAMCLTELSPTNWLFGDAGVPKAAVYNIDFGLGARKNSSKNSSTDLQNQLMCPRQCLGDVKRSWIWDSKKLYWVAQVGGMHSDNVRKCSIHDKI